jgi:hypothetical protein
MAKLPVKGGIDRPLRLRPKNIAQALAASAETISDAPPPQVVNKALTGRIPQNWKGNGK